MKNFEITKKQMPRPKKERIVHRPPIFSEYKPVGAGKRMLDKVLLTLDEYEALRLADFEGLSHEEAAEEMEVSRSTFTRLVEKARQKTSDFLINGKVLAIEGGNIHFRRNTIKCLNCGYMFNINIDADFARCPQCGSENLVNLAGGFGHGRCCVNRNKKGGKNAGRR